VNVKDHGLCAAAGSGAYVLPRSALAAGVYRREDGDANKRCSKKRMVVNFRHGSDLNLAAKCQAAL
jgi:hypothetical protein